MRAIALLFFLAFAALVLGCSATTTAPAPRPAPPAPVDTSAWIPQPEVGPQ